MTQEPLPSSLGDSPLLRISGTLVAHFLALLFVTFVMVKVVPAYAQVFDQLQVALPEVTRWVIMFSDICVAFWYLMIPTAMLVDALIVIALAYAAPRKRWLLSSYSHLCLLGSCALFAYVAAWIGHPVYSLIR